MVENQLILGDSFEVLKSFPDNSVDAIITDPPYYKAKKEKWDRQWDKPEGFLNWLDLIAEQWQRILKPNGSLYCFASPKMSARVEVKLSERFNICNHLVWNKNGQSRAAMTCKEESRIYFPESERIIFCEHYGADSIAKGEAGYNAKCDELRGFIFEPLRAYLDGERLKTGCIVQVVKELWQKDKKNKGGIAGHWFTSCQWRFPSSQSYLWLQNTFKGYFLRPYEDLRREYEDLRRPFFLTADVPYTDVWTFPTVSFYQGKHPCEKPLDLIKHIVTTSTRENQVILDCFGGSGTTAIACLKTGRKYIVIEREPEYYEIAKKRINDWHNENTQLELDVK